MALTDTFTKQVKPTGKASGDKYADAGGTFLLVKPAKPVKPPKPAGKYWRMD